MVGAAHAQPGLGTGIYTYAEAARFLRVSSAKVRRWAEGYVYWLNGEQRRKGPVLQRERPPLGLLTFCDLVELFFVREFDKAGVKLQDIRDSARLLADELKTPYPFACERLHTDGVQILRAKGRHYENVARQQKVFKFAEDFFKKIEFADDCLARRWWPMGPDKLVVIDPHRSFGTPIEAKSGIRTDVLYAAYKAEEGDSKAVAEWYEISREGVESAVKFEEEWLKAA